MLNFAKLLILACTVTAASAIQISFPSGSAPASGQIWWNAYDNTHNVAIRLICDDFSHFTSVSSLPAPSAPSYTYNQVQATDANPNPFGSARWATNYLAIIVPTGTAEYVFRYRAAALLIAELLGAPGAPTVNVANATMAEYQDAIWDLFDYGNAKTVSSRSLSLWTDAFNAAKGDYSAMVYKSIYNSLVVYTPAAGNTNQEFVGYVPEPSQGVALLAMLGLGWFVRRRRMA